MTKHNCHDLTVLFNDLFEQREKTILVGNGEEPLYLPCDEKNSFNQIIFTRDYFASALHEVAHWCIASTKRRALVDYGYWYFPEGRNAEQQQLFEQVEVQPQALECIFAEAAGSSFTISQDNLTAEQMATSETFAKKVAEQVRHYHRHGLPERAEMFRNCLNGFYKK